MVEMYPPDMQLTPELIRAWRRGIEIHRIRIQLGEFNWPWALSIALNRVEQLERQLEEARTRSRADVKVDTAAGGRFWDGQEGEH